jgi:protein-S-isoprenylcysteine O-methyltransferase Ste14
METYQIIAIVLLACLYTLFFLKNFALRKRGIRVIRLMRGDKPKKTYIIELFLAAVTVAVPVTELASVIFIRFLTPLTVNTTLRWDGLILAFIGTAFFGAALAAMRENWRAGIDRTQETRLVVRGVYRISRNPAFVGFDLFYAGFAMAFSNPANIALSVAAVVLFHLQILEEEKYLKETFGEEYLNYAKKTMRYLGIRKQ